jgi:Phage gp6-like head-tail connector protein
VIDVGDPLPDLGVLVYNTAGSLAAATTVALTITLPDGTSTSPTVSTASTGIYSATYTTTMAGRHVARWTATTITAGAAQERYEQTWDVSDVTRLIVGLDDAKTYLRITGSSDDEQLRDVLEAASDLCERHTRKVWRRTTVTAELHSGGGDVLYLRQAPVVSVTSVTDTGVAITSSYYTLDAPTGRLFFGDTVSTGYWTPGQENISVTYVTGPPSGVVPAYIRRGLLVLLEHLWATQRGGSNLPRLAGGSDEYDRRMSFTLPRRVLEAWGEPAPLVR